MGENGQERPAGWPSGPPTVAPRPIDAVLSLTRVDGEDRTLLMMRMSNIVGVWHHWLSADEAIEVGRALVAGGEQIKAGELWTP